MTRPVLLAFLMVSLAQCVYAEDLINPDRPGIADGSAVVGKGVFQFETGVDRTRDDLATPTLLRYGLTRSLEARVESNAFTLVRGGGSAWTPLSVGVKWHFDDAPSLATIVRVSVPSGTGEMKQTVATGDIRLAADFSFGEKWSINPNVGIASELDGRRFTAALAAMTIQYNLSDRANVFVDGGFASPESKNGPSALLLDAGAAVILGRNTQLDASATWRGRGRTAPDLTLSAGVSHRF
jgi:hypothetical protein